MRARIGLVSIMIELDCGKRLILANPQGVIYEYRVVRSRRFDVPQQQAQRLRSSHSSISSWNAARMRGGTGAPRSRIEHDRSNGGRATHAQLQAQMRLADRIPDTTSNSPSNSGSGNAWPHGPALRKLAGRDRA